MTKIHSIAWLHAKLDKHIKLVEAYSEVIGLAFAIRSCRLLPSDYVVQYENKTKLFNKWLDEYGNSLILDKKTPNIIYNDLSVDHSKLVCTDLYSGLAISQIALMSKKVFLIAGKDEDQHDDCFLLSFLGLDDFLRSYLFLYGEWRQVSPLLLGLENLQLLYASRDKDIFAQLDKRESLVPPCTETEAWISCLPVHEDLLRAINHKYERLLPILGTNP